MGQPRIFSIIDKACYDYKMIEEGDRILVGASGGKDSTALIEYLYNRKKRLNSNFVFECVFIKTEFGKPLPPNILSCFEKWNIVLKTIDIDIEERSREDKKLGCYWCSTQRRTELLKYAIDNNFNKIFIYKKLTQQNSKDYFNLSSISFSPMPILGRGASCIYKHPSLSYITKKGTPLGLSA